MALNLPCYLCIQIIILDLSQGSIDLLVGDLQRDKLCYSMFSVVDRTDRAEIKRLDRVFFHSLQICVDVKNAWIDASVPYVLMAWRLKTKHSDKFHFCLPLQLTLYDSTQQCVNLDVPNSTERPGKNLTFPEEL